MRSHEIVDLLREALRQRIVEPGETVNEEEMARRMGVSRTPVREALRVLAGEGLVSITPGIGAIVNKLTVDEMVDLYKIRLVLEPSMAEDIIDKCGRREFTMLAALVDKMDQAAHKDPETWSNLNYNFHESMYELTGRYHAHRLIVQVLNIVEPYTRIYVHQGDAYERVRGEHRAMLDAIAAGDPAALAAAITSHHAGARDGLIRQMEPEPARLSARDLA